MDTKKNKWEQGNGEVIGFAIMTVAICSIIVIMVSILQMSVGLNAITKAANVVGRAAAVCTSKEDAEEQIQKVAENAVTYAGIKNLRTCYEIFEKILSMMKETYQDKEVLSYQYIACG